MELVVLPFWRTWSNVAVGRGVAVVLIEAEDAGAAEADAGDSVLVVMMVLTERVNWRGAWVADRRTTVANMLSRMNVAGIGYDAG